MAGIKLLCFLILIYLIKLITSKKDPNNSYNITLNGVYSEDLNDGNYRLPKDLKPLHYRLQIQPFFEPLFAFKGNVTIKFICNNPTDRIILHGLNLTLENYLLRSVVKNKINILKTKRHFEIEKKHFLVFELNDYLEKGKMYEIDFQYSGDLSLDLEGFYLSSYNDSKTGPPRWLAATDLEPTDARRVLPCFDEPEMKAVFEVIVIRPKDMISLSNTKLLKSIPWKNNNVMDYFKPSPKMSIYLLAIIVCDFVSKKSETSRGVEVRVWTRKDMLDRVDYALDVAVKSIEFYEDYFSIKYPLEKMDLVALPDFRSGAMENWGIITFREYLLLLDEETTTEVSRQHVAITIQHEVSHQWFGNLVTMKWWDDLWLNEGFATAMEYISGESIHPDWRMEDSLVYAETFESLYSDSFANSHPISVSVNNPDEIGQIFDSISYSKGAALIRMMIFVLGIDVFRAGIKDYLQKFSFKNSIQDNLWQALNQANDNGEIDIAEVMRTWTLQKGYPLITINRNYEQKTTKIMQNYFIQTTGSEIPTDKPYKWEVPVSYLTENDKQWNPSQIIWLHQKNVKMNSLLSPPRQWILGNVNVTGFYRVNYDEKNWLMLIEQLLKDHKKIPPNNRGQIIDDLFALARAGSIAYDVALNASTYLYQEDDPLTWRIVLESFTFVMDMLKVGKKEHLFKLFLIKNLYPVYKSLGWNEDRTSESHLQLLHRSKILSNACNIGFKDCIRNAKKFFKHWKENPKQNRLSPNLEKIILCHGIRYGRQEDWDFVWKQYLSTSDSVKRVTFLQALGCTYSSSLLKRYLAMTINSSSIRSQDVDTVVNGISTSYKGYLLAWEYYKGNWESSKTRGIYMENTLSNIANFFYKESELKNWRKFYEENKKHLSHVSRTFEEGEEVISGNIKWKKQNEKTILEWLNNNVK